MKKKSLIFIPLIVLAGCNTPVEIKERTLTFEEAYLELFNVQLQEMNDASEEIVVKSTIAGESEKTKKSTYTLYDNGVVGIDGIYKYQLSDQTVISDPFKGIRTSAKESYKDGEEETQFNFYFDIVDYENDLSHEAQFSDSFTKKFIFNSREEAEESGVDSSLYILRSQLALYSRANITADLANFIADLFSNVYLEQLGLTTIKATKDDDKNWNYEFVGSYSYVEEGINTETNISLTYQLNESRNRINSISTSHMQTESDKDSSYTSGLVEEATIRYEERKDDSSKEIKVKDYELTSISKFGLKARDSKFNDIVVDPSKVPFNCSYLFPYAEIYTPVKALDISINYIGSSNEEVVAFNKGMFEVKGVGTTTLSLSYYKKVNNVYQNTTVTMTVTISDAQAESVSILPKSNFYEQFGLVPGLTYKWDTSVYPSKVAQEVTATSSDDSIMSVSVNDKNQIVLEPKKEGKVTITVASFITPEVTTSKEFYVLADDFDYVTFITTNTFHHDSPYNYTMDMTFNSDGTGTRIQTITDGSNRSYTDTFNWTIENNVIRYSNWSYVDQNSYEIATIMKFLDTTGEPLGMYAETDAKGQKFLLV